MKPKGTEIKKTTYRQAGPAELEIISLTLVIAALEAMRGHYAAGGVTGVPFFPLPLYSPCSWNREKLPCTEIGARNRGREDVLVTSLAFITRGCSQSHTQSCKPK